MYRLTAEQQAIVDRAGTLADERIAPHAAAADAEAAFPHPSIRALGEAGFLGLTVPAEFGGMGQGLRVAAAVLDQIAQRCPSTAMVLTMHLCGIACYTAMPEHTATQLRIAAAGQHLTTLAWSERGSRSHFWAPVSRAVARDGSVVINAEKSFVTSAGEADGYVVSTQWAEAQAPTESMLYLVRKEDAGIAVAGPWQALGMRGNASAPMSLRGVTIPATRALSAEGRGMDTMLGVVLPWFQIGNAAISIGIAEAAVRATQQHLVGTHFEHLGSTLADLPNQRTRLAQMRIETDRARAHLVSVLGAVEDGDAAAMLHVLAAKPAAAEAAIMVTELGMRAGGGAAFRTGMPLERLFRDARAAVVMAPTTDMVHEFIGRALVGMELFA